MPQAEYVVPSDLIQVVVGHLLDGLTTVQAAQEPCEHGLRYRGTGRACGYCLAVAEMAVDGVNDRAVTGGSTPNPTEATGSNANMDGVS